MKKKFEKYTRKALSVFMAFIMVFTMFVFTPGMFKKAEAATAGSYTLSFKINVSNEADKQDSIQDSYYTIYYKPNNGSGTETNFVYNLKNNWTSVGLNSSGEHTFKVTVPGWPTKVVSYHDAVWNDYVHYEMKAITVSGPSKSASMWSGNQEVHSGGWGNSVDNDTFTLSATAPYAASISIGLKNAQSVTVPASGTASSTTATTATVKDQYGVVWYGDASWAVNTKGEAVTSSVSLTGISAGSGCLNVTNSAKTTLGGSSKIYYINAFYGTLKSEVIPVTVTNIKYKFTVKGNSGTLSSGTGDKEAFYGEKYGITPAATREGYTLTGFYLTQFNDSFETPKYSGTVLAADTTIDANRTWYAAWQANKYAATFNKTVADENGAVETVKHATQDVYITKTPAKPADPEGYKSGDYDYTFSAWSPSISAMVSGGATYTATYTSQFVPADYSALETAINAAKAVISDDEYESAYSELSRRAVTKALADAETFNAAEKVGRTKQTDVDSKTTALNDAVAALQPAEYSVLYINSLDDTIIDIKFPIVNNTAIPYPADDKIPNNISDDASGHYVFKEWVPASSDYDKDFVKTNMIMYAEYELKEHKFTSETITTDCTSEGITVYTCSDCGYSYEELNGTTGSHVWADEYTADIPATCTTDGSESIHCTVCTAKKNERTITALGHDFEGAEVETILAAGCEKQGVTAKICKKCESKVYEVTPAGSHSYTTVVTQPTCTSNGYTTKTCSKCDDVVITDFTPLKAHTYTEDESKAVAPSCEGVGLKYSYCSCGAEKVEVVPANGHTWAAEATEDFAPTCTAEGQKSIKCEECSAIKADSITAIGKKAHDFNTTPETIVSATCGVNSVTKYACANGCGQINVVTGTENYTHTYGDWVVTDATCDAAGSKTRTCSRCGNTDTEVISMKPHSYATTSVAATCTMPAGIKYDCATCDASYIVYDGEANGHSLSYTVSGGKVTISCDNCSYEEIIVDELPLDGGHNWAKTSETAPTCTAAGSVVFTCTDDDCTVDDVEIAVSATGVHNITTTVTPATCFTAGKAVSECSECDYKTETAIAAKGHTYTFPGTVTQAATCQQNGVITYTCKDCSNTQTETTPAIGHVFEATAETYEATCNAGAYTVYKCKTCDETMNVTSGVADATKHNFVVTTAVNGNQTDVKVECSICGAKKETTVDAPHHYSNVQILTPSTCSATGVARLYCGDADCSYTTDVVLDKISHTYVASYTPATCLADGSIRFFCSACGAEDTSAAITIARIDHTFGATPTHVEATCTTSGYDKFECATCGEVIYKNLTPATNNHSLVATPVAATCYSKSGTKYTCSVCGFSYKVLDGEYAPHTWAEEATVLVPASCTGYGQRAYFCTVCHAQGVTTSMGKLDHQIDDVNMVDCGEGIGYTWKSYKCKDCSFSVADVEIIVLDDQGNVVPNAEVGVTNEKGKLVKHVNADVNGVASFGVFFRTGEYHVVIRTGDNRLSGGAFYVAGNGAVVGAMIPVATPVPPEDGTCGHFCHKDSFFARLIRQICTFFSSVFGRTIKCCDDMEWYGDRAEGLK